MATSDDGETVDAFLERIASLKIKRDREDEERTRKLEEEILQGRRERQARRAERARSLSPPKESTTTSSPTYANSPTNSTLSQSIQPPVDLRPSPRPNPSFVEVSMDHYPTPARDQVISDPSRALSVPRTASPTKSIQHTVPAISRSGTLSWQQRPSSRDSNSSRSRPTSGPSMELVPPRASDMTKPAQEELSRAEIAQSLGSKDPTWFRQTADRGFGSAALRRNQEDLSRDKSSAEGRMRLPGMSRESTADPEKSLPQESVRYRATSPLEDGSRQGTNRQDDPFESSYSTAAATRPPLPFSSSQRLMPAEGPTQDEVSARPSEHAPNHTKSLPDRPLSPTKGLGGFVQSAMMKRSDSVNKRWSTQAAPGLKRGDSIAGQRGTLGSLAPVPLMRGGSPPGEAKPSLGPTSSPSSHSRPDSSHSTSSFSQKQLMTHQHDTESVNGAASWKLDVHAADVSEKSKRGTEPCVEVSGGGFRSASLHEELPASPTKTMDPKRWSPTKASWLESALSKPESPKITSPKVEQPMWRSDLLKSKQSGMNSGESRSLKPSFEVATQPGLMRSPPPGGHSRRPLSIGGLPEGFSSGLVKKAPIVRQKSPSLQEDSISGSAAPGESLSNQSSGATIPTEIGIESTTAPRQPAFQEDAACETDTNPNWEQPLDSSPRGNPPALKPKPQTSPKTDFRANLKPRQKDSQGSASAEPEFKNVFGKLRRTETKNYVAPDVLKANILSGKAALNLTGGPQKTKRTDEFKESILSQKEAMKAGGGSIHKKPETNKDSSVAAQKPVVAIPEALARRKQLSKISGTTVGPVETTPTVQASICSKASVKHHSDLSNVDPASTVAKGIEPSEQTSVPQTKSDATTLTFAEIKPPIASARLANAEPGGKAGSGRLANRMNPALASILMRGSPSNPSSRNHSTEDLSASLANSGRPTASSTQDSGDGQLTHMTKGRAKGPKRRLPKAEVVNKEADIAKPVAAAKSPEVRKVSSAKPQLDGWDGAASRNPASSNSIPSPLPNRPLATLVNQNEKIKPSLSKPSPKPDMKQAEDLEASNRPNPPVAQKSPDLRRVPSPKSQPTRLEDAGSVAASDTIGPTSPLATKTVYPSKRAIHQERAQSPPLLVEDGQVGQSRNEAKPNFTPEPQAAEKKTVDAASRLNGLGLKLGNSKLSPTNIPKSEPTPPEKNAFGTRTAEAESPKRHAATSIQAEGHAMDPATGATARKLLGDFFHDYPKVGDKADIDAHAVVSANGGAIDKTRTLRMQIWEVNGDGKRQDMPPQQEHILFEDSMYLCVHSLENDRGSKSTEAFLWCGDKVGEAAGEDAQLFCRKIARENGAKLELLKQGKETASFIQALGGIIITRRSKSSALYMLCGRRHLGHVSFDEVDIDADNLCSGFPYLISARFGKLYLWKGRGSGADELGCARLIGMDLGLTGEIEEVKEGEEPPSFWDGALGMKARSPWSGHWTLRGTPNRHPCRLFRIELDNPRLGASFWSRRASSPAKGTKSGLVKEITPFCQRDLEAGCIFVLDAYFEIYVFVGGEASSKSPEFVTALFFAQEYSILATSIQDRPLVPPCYVAFAEVPPDFRAVFRKWTPIPPKGAGGRANAIPLNVVIEALA